MPTAGTLDINKSRYLPKTSVSPTPPQIRPICAPSQKRGAEMLPNTPHTTPNITHMRPKTPRLCPYTLYALFSRHFPIQNREKISSNTASFVISPVIPESSSDIIRSSSTRHSSFVEPFPTLTISSFNFERIFLRV